MNRNLPHQLTVFDGIQDCSYLPGRTSRLPLRWPLASLTPEQMDECLRAGDRRTGVYLYNTRCPGCLACEPIRLDVGRFQPSRTQRRIERLGERDLRCSIGRPQIDAPRLALFNKHRHVRRLAGGDGDIDADEYRSFLVDTCCETIEISYWLDERLVAVALCDCGAESLSAVYCHFDPDCSRYSLGTYSVLKQVEFCRRSGRRHLYLGYYVADSEHMAYKAAFGPHERRIDGKWREFPRTGTPSRSDIPNPTSPW